MKSESIVITFYALIALCSSNPVGGQQDIEPELRLDFTNDFVEGLFTHLAQSKFRFESDYINRLITENRIKINKEKLDHSSIDIHSILYNNIITDSFINLATNTAHYLQNTLSKVGMQSIDVETTMNRSIVILIQTFRIFAYKALIICNDRQQLDELVKTMNNDIEIIIDNLAKQMIEFIPVSLAQDFDEVFGILQSIFHYWTISLARSLIFRLS
jgi:hypothetical protein